MRRSVLSRDLHVPGVGGLEVFVVILIGILVMTAFGGCTIKRTVTPEDFSKEEARLTENIKVTSEPDELSDFYLRRARLRLKAGNPRPDYSGALEDLKNAIAMRPRRWRVEELKDWMAALSRLVDLERQNRSLRRNVELLEKHEQELRRNVEQLEKQEKELQSVIEQLQSLELEREQRRRELR